MRFQCGLLLDHVQALGGDIVQVALGSGAVLDHRGELLLAGRELLLQVTVECELVLQQQQGKVHLVDAFAHCIQIHVELSLLHSTLLLCYLALCADNTAVIHRLLHIQAHTVLVFGQALHVNAQLAHHRLHLVGPRRHGAL